ncbi:MAG TPA: two-component regulator propeller domain-containing protein, partial [Rhodothermales bacterium]|nr:two-component regulator propeller domain-containing protein [Rhodothermales bacterium]
MKRGTRWLMLIAVAWAWMLCPWKAPAQQYAFRQYGVEAGVPIAHALAFDARHTLLVGTNDGLYRFDGRIFDAVSLPGIDETSVQRMITGPRGIVWAVADPNRLFLINGMADPVEIEVPAALREGLGVATWYQRLRTDPAGRLWLNDPDAGLWCYDPALARWMDFRLPGVREVTDFFFEDAETLWLADTDRVGRLWLKGEHLGEVEWLVEVPRVVYIRPHPAGAWIGTREGLFLTTRWGNKRQVLGPEYVAWWYSKPDVDRTGRLFTCLEHNYRLGVYRLGPDGTLELQAEEGSTLRDAKVLQILFDEEGGSWFANTSGLTHLEQEYLVSYPVVAPDGTPEVVKDLVPDPSGGPPWVATWGGLYAFEQGSLQRISVMPRAATSRPATDRDGNVWWNDMGGGAFTYHHGQKSRAVGGGIFRLYDASDGIRLFSTDAGTFKESNGKIHKIGPGGWKEVLVAETSSDYLWIRAERLDVVVGDSLGSACKTCLPPSVRNLLTTFEKVNIMEMYPDHLGRIWAAVLTPSDTLRGLICIYRKADGTWTYRHFGTEQGMLDNVSSIFPTPDGRLWVGTWRGIQAFTVTPGEPELTPLFQLRARDGLDGENIEALVEDDQGFLWIGCAAGKLHRLDYRRMVRLSSPPSYIAQMERDGLTTPTGEDPLRLRAHASRLAIRLAAQTYRMPRQVRFQYRLLPGDTTWVDLGTARSVQFPLLPAGSYRFEAR